jgi:hypothetical protein
MSMASGLPEWSGNKVKKANVVYLAGEGHAGLRGRIAAWKQNRKVSKMDMWVSKSGCDLNTSQGYQQVSEQLRSMQIQPNVIVVDTLHRFLKGDENSAQDTKTMLDACAALMMEFNCTVILVHHTGVSDEAQHRARGSSAWRGALEIEISIVPGKGDAPMEIIQRKSKDSELAEPLYCTLESVAIEGWIDEDGEPVSSAVIEFADAPVKAQKESTFDKNLRLFKNAWWRSGAEVGVGGMPVLSKSALIQYLVDEGLYAEKAVRNQVTASKHNGFIGTLVIPEMIKVNFVNNEIREFEVINPELGAVMLVAKKEDTPL